MSSSWPASSPGRAIALASPACQWPSRAAATASRGHRGPAGQTRERTGRGDGSDSRASLQPAPRAKRAIARRKCGPLAGPRAGTRRCGAACAQAPKGRCMSPSRSHRASAARAADPLASPMEYALRPCQFARGPPRLAKTRGAARARGLGHAMWHSLRGGTAGPMDDFIEHRIGICGSIHRSADTAALTRPTPRTTESLGGSLIQFAAAPPEPLARGRRAAARRARLVESRTPIGPNFDGHG